MQLARYLYRFLAIALLTLVITVCSDSVAGPDTEASEHLLFLSTRDGVLDDLERPMREIYRMSIGAAADPVNLTHQPAFWYGHFSLSPDGRSVVFSRPDCGVWSMNVDGSGLRALAAGAAGNGCNASPRWSPDGSRIAFTSSRDGRSIGSTHGLSDVYVMNADGSDPRNVSHSMTDELGHNVDVAGWSPDGQIVFETNGLGDQSTQRSIYGVNPDGSGARLLFEAGDHSPAWSPDGTQVVFIREMDGRRRLHVANADGTDARALTDHSGDDQLSGGCCGLTSARSDVSPWSPDGEWIAYTRFVTVSDWGTIYVVRPNGTGTRRLTDFTSQFNGWSPDGSRIALTGWPTSNPDIFLIDADGSGLRNLTDSPAADTDAFWVRY